MEDYNIGDVWWVRFPFSDSNDDKRRPAIVIDDEKIAILAMYVTSKNKDNPFSIEIEDWKNAGLTRKSWARIDKIVSITEWNMLNKIGELSDRDLSKILQLVKEILSNKFHEFTLIAVKNHKGDFLLKYDDRWDCWLFPYVRSSEGNKINADTFISNLLNIEIETEYVTCAKHCKYSVSDEVYKIYNHKLYSVELRDIPQGISSAEFSLNNNKYRWMSITDMENDEDILQKNSEVVAFVASKLHVGI